jgi:hypothetical protein
MDIYFCDLCGARVTDLDLRGGHGMRRQFDIICAGCVEKGQGKSWLTGSQQREQQRRTGSSSGGSTAEMHAMPLTSSSSDIISQARDRARTIEDGPAASVSPKMVAADPKNDVEDNAKDNDSDLIDSADELAFDTEDAHDAIEKNNADRALDDDAAVKDKPAPAMNNHFAAAASSFSALSNPPKRPATDADDIPSADDDDAELNDADAVQETKPQGDKKDEKNTTVRGAKMSDKSPNPTARKTNPSAVATRPGTASSTKTSGAKAGPVGKNSGNRTPPGNAMRSSGANSTASVGNATRNSSKTIPKPSGKNKSNQKNQQIIILSAISVGILILLTLIFTAGSGKAKPKTDALPPINLSENLKTAIKDAKAAARAALGPKKLDEMNPAKAAILATQQDVELWSKEAAKQGYTDEELGHTLEIVDYPNTRSLLRNLNDEIAKQSIR